MNIEALIAAKKAQRSAGGLTIVQEFDNREPFTRYCATREQADRWLEKAKTMIGKTGPDGCTCTAAYVKAAA